jgi:hypothetical protein
MQVGEPFSIPHGTFELRIRACPSAALRVGLLRACGRASLTQHRRIRIDRAARRPSRRAVETAAGTSRNPPARIVADGAERSSLVPSEGATRVHHAVSGCGGRRGWRRACVGAAGTGEDGSAAGGHPHFLEATLPATEARGAWPPHHPMRDLVKRRLLHRRGNAPPVSERSIQPGSAASEWAGRRRTQPGVHGRSGSAVLPKRLLVNNSAVYFPLCTRPPEPPAPRRASARNSLQTHDAIAAARR